MNDQKWTNDPQWMKADPDALASHAFAMGSTRLGMSAPMVLVGAEELLSNCVAKIDFGTGEVRPMHNAMARPHAAPAQMSDDELQEALRACVAPGASGKAQTAFNYLLALQREVQRRELRKMQGHGNRHERRARVAKQRRVH